MITINAKNEPPVKFTLKTGEELVITPSADGFLMEYLDTEDMIQTWSIHDGFVRRLSLKRNDASNNVVSLSAG